MELYITHLVYFKSMTESFKQSILPNKENRHRIVLLMMII